MDVAILGLIATGATGVLGFCRWAVKLWADVRRETIASQEKRAGIELQDQRDGRAEQRKMYEQMVETMLDQTRSNAALEHSNRALGEKVDRLTQRIDDMDWRAHTGHTPVQGIEVPRPETPRPALDGPSAGHRIPTARPDSGIPARRRGERGPNEY